MLRLIHVDGIRVALRTYWGADCEVSPGVKCYHDADRTIAVLTELPQRDAEGIYRNLGAFLEKPAEYAAEPWPTRCDRCGAEAPGDATHEFLRTEHFDTPSGYAEPNDCWYDDFGPHAANFYCPWTNCDGKHLTIVLPVEGYREGHSVRGLRWEPGHRAQNCTMPSDTTHRCWVIAGEAPKLSSVEAPNRCGAGRCSTQVGDVFHKTLRDGEWV